MNQQFCPICKSKDYQIVQDGVKDFEYGTKGSYSWLKCLCCKLIRINPMPTPELLSQAYPSHYHAYAEPKSKLTQKLLAISRKRLAKKMVSNLPQNTSILEIGCSTGYLLQDIGSLGKFNLFGVEYKKEAAEEARTRKITVWEGTFEDANIPKESMDLTIMQHVIEHVYNPMETLKKIHALLKDGGKIVGELPNIDSWDAYIFGKYWGGGHAPRHIWFFNPKTLKSTLESCGFTNIKIKPSLHTGHWALSIQNFLRRNKTDCKGLISGRSWYYPFLLVTTIPPNLLQMPFLKTGVMCFEGKKIK